MLKCDGNTQHPLISIFVLLQTSDWLVGFLFYVFLFSLPFTDFNLWVASDFGSYGWFPFWGWARAFFFGCNTTLYSANGLWPNTLLRKFSTICGILVPFITVCEKILPPFPQIEICSGRLVCIIYVCVLINIHNTCTYIL